MQNDDITWSIINKHHCSYKIKTDTQWFCRNEYNVTGLCNRKGCPLANSQYATVREEKGIVYLYVRRAENVYKPCQAWQKVKLSKTFVTALQQIEDTLVFWPNYFKQKCRQRLLKITQYLARMRKMKLHDTKKLVPVRRKEEKRLAKREEKALVAAKLDNVIEKQLLERLKSGTYERIYNFPLQAFDVRLENEEIETDDEFDIEEEELEEEGERVQVKVEEGENEEEEEMDEELREELERGVVRELRQDDSSEEEGEDEVDAESGEDEDTLALEDDSDAESDEEEDSQIEYVADFNESSDEEPEMDIEDLPQKLMPKARAVTSASRKQQDDGDSSDPEEQDIIHRKKYDPQQPVRPSKKFALKKMQAKQKLRAIYEKEKMEKEKKKVRIGAGRR